MKKIVFIFLIMLIAGFSPVFAGEILHSERGIVTQVEYVDTSDIMNDENIHTHQNVEVKLLSGKFKGEKIFIENQLTSNPAYDIILKRGDKVILHAEAKGELIDDVDDINYFIADIERTGSLYILAFIFAGLLFVIGRKKGLLSFCAIFFTVAMIFWVMRPMILFGISPIFSALSACFVSTILTVYLVGGFNKKSTSAVIGTVLSLCFAALLSLLTIKIANLTGFAGEETVFLYSTRPDLDFTGILSASMMLAALGAVMDVGVSIASTINEVFVTDNSLSVNDLFAAGMNVGRDIIGTMSNTLILVYLGSSLPLLLLSSNVDFVKFFNLNTVVTEISSAFIGSIAVLLCVPVTALVSSYLIKTNFKKNI